MRSSYLHLPSRIQYWYSKVYSEDLHKRMTRRKCSTGNLVTLHPKVNLQPNYTLTTPSTCSCSNTHLVQRIQVSLGMSWCTIHLRGLSLTRNIYDPLTGLENTRISLFFDGCQSAVMHTALPPSPSPSQLRAMPLTLPACLGCVPYRTRLCDTTPTHPPPLGLCAVGQITLLHPLSVHAKERGGGAGEGPVLVALPYGRG